MRITDVRVFPIASFGQDPTRIEPIWQDVFRGTFWRGGPVSSPPRPAPIPMSPCGT